MASYAFDTNEDADTRRRRRRQNIAELLAEQADTKPIQSPWQGAAKMANAGISGLLLGMEEKRDRELLEASTAHNAGGVPGLFSGGEGGGSPVTAALAGKPIGGPIKLGGFEPSVGRVLEFEGGLNPNDSNGAPSNFGINAKANPDVDVANLTPQGATEIYRKRYWDAIGADKMDPRLAHVAFDTAVIAGPGKANELLKASGGDPEKFLALREQFQNKLLAANPEKYGPYAKAWGNRVATLRSDVGVGGGGQPGGMMAVGGGSGQTTLAGGDTLEGGNANARIQQLYRFATNPMTNAVNNKIALDEIERLRKGSDPAAAVELDNKKLQNQKLRRELEGGGDVPLTEDERKQFNVPKGQPASRTRDGGIKFGPAGTTIKNEGNIPPGYRAVRDANDNLVSVEPIPGTKEDKAAVAKREATTGRAQRVLGAIDDVEKLMKDARLPTTGFVGNWLSQRPGTAAHDIAKQVDTIEANVSFEELGRMREQSPTGAALGSVTERELMLLGATIASLRQSQSEPQFKKNLQKVRDTYLDIIHGPGNRPKEAAPEKGTAPAPDDLKKKYGLD